MQTYAIMYKDQTYQTYELSDEDYKKLAEASLCGIFAVQLSIGVFRLEDVRSVVAQKPAEENPRPNGSDPDLPLDYQDYIRQLRLADEQEVET